MDVCHPVTSVLVLSKGYCGEQAATYSELLEAVPGCQDPGYLSLQPFGCQFIMKLYGYVVVVMIAANNCCMCIC